MNDRLKYRYWQHTDWHNENSPLEAVYCNIVDGCDPTIAVSDFEFCTGLKDKNGNLIYEGDIIKCEIDVKHELSVVWDDGCFGVYVPLHDEFVQFYPLGNFSKHEWDVKNIEIVGNVHKNKGE